MPPNFSSTREDGRRRVQAAGRSSPRCPLLSTASPVLQVRAAPSASLRLPAPSAQRRGQPPAPLLSCNASFPQLPLPPLPKAQRLQHDKELGLCLVAKPPATTGKRKGVCAHICQRLDFLEGIWTLSPSPLPPRLAACSFPRSALLTFEPR